MNNEITIVSYDSYVGFTFQKVKLTEEEMTKRKKINIPLSDWEKLRKKLKIEKIF